MRNPIAFLHRDGLAADRDGELLRRARLMLMAPAPTMQGRPMPRATTAAWLDLPPTAVRMPFGDVHAVNVVGRGFLADQNHGTVLRQLDGFLGGETRAADGRAGRRGDAGGEQGQRSSAMPHRTPGCRS